MTTSSYVQTFEEKMRLKSCTVGIVGLGYVGLPLALAFCDRGIKVLGFDIDTKKIEMIAASKSYIKHIPDDVIAKINSVDLLHVTDDFSLISEVDAVLICVPTPLSKYREPDLSSVLNTGKSISPHLRKGQLVVRESSTYPGTTDSELTNTLEHCGLKSRPAACCTGVKIRKRI